jgi:nucleotide-binding universal stress UspA family protein
MSAFANKILLATDGSPEAEGAARMAVTLAHGLNSELHVVYVGRMPGAYALSEAKLIDPEFQSRLREHAEQYARAKLDEEVEKIDRMTGKVAEAHVGVGSPEVEIVRLAEELDAGLVVLGSRGFGPLKRALMGSVSESVVRYAHCPVLVARKEKR